MNGAHLHLLSNHLPIIIPIIALLILITGLLFKSNVTQRIALSIFMLGALLTLPALLSGEGAEDIVESAGNKAYIETHEEVAETFAVLSYILGAWAAVGLWASWKQKSYAKFVSLSVLVFSCVVLFFAQQTGNSGGQIMHEEIRANASYIAPQTNTIEHTDED